jgi:hypothetical protein
MNISRTDVLRKNMYSNNIFSDMGVMLDELEKLLEETDELLDVLDRIHIYSIMKWLTNEELIYDILKNPDKYRVFNKNTPKPITMKLIRTLGLVREQKIEQWLRDAFPEYEGYVVKHWNKENEPDFIIYKDDKPFWVVEVKNYGEKSYMLESEFQKIIKRLTKYSCFKLLIVSTGYNLIRKTIQTHNNKQYTYYNTKLRKTSEELRNKGIYTWILGYQDLMSMKQFNEIVRFAKQYYGTDEEVEGWVDEC